MALSKINTAPIYECSLPSNAKVKVKYRPFVVKEEKALLTAQQSDDPVVMFNTLVNIIRGCITEIRPAVELTAFDFEFLFLQIRAKSVGEIIDNITITCECDAKAENKVQINLETDLLVSNQTTSKFVDLVDGYKLELKHLSLEDVSDIASASDEEKEWLGIARSIKSVFNDEEVIRIEEESEDEIRAFVNNLTQAQRDKVREFIETAPQVSVNVKYKCETCGQEIEKQIKGISNFF